MQIAAMNALRFIRFRVYWNFIDVLCRVEVGRFNMKAGRCLNN